MTRRDNPALQSRLDSVNKQNIEWILVRLCLFIHCLLNRRKCNNINNSNVVVLSCSHSTNMLSAGRPATDCRYPHLLLNIPVRGSCSSDHGQPLTGCTRRGWGGPLHTSHQEVNKKPEYNQLSGVGPQSKLPN